MTFFVFAVATQDPSLSGLDGGGAVRALAGMVFVLGVLLLVAWLLRRGTFGKMGSRKPDGIRVESAVPLGERRSLMIVNVEGRRLLLGLTPQAVSLVAELRAGEPAFDKVLAQASGQPPTEAL